MGTIAGTIRVFLGLVVVLFTAASACLGQMDQETTDLLAACKLRDTEKIEASLAAGADVNGSDALGLTALYYAVKADNKGIVDLLLANSADINQQAGIHDNRSYSSERMPVLMWAVKMNRKDMVENLLAKGADPEVGDSFGVWPLCLAAGVEDYEIFELFAKQEEDLHKRYWISRGYSGTLLHVTVGAGNIQVADYLLEHKVDTEARDSSERSALFLASLIENLEMAKLLVEYDAFIYATNSWGKSPFSPMSEQYANKVVVYLREVEKEKYHVETAQPAWRGYIEKSERVFTVDVKGLEAYIRDGGLIHDRDHMRNTVLHLVAGGRLGKSDLLTSFCCAKDIG